MTAWEVSQAVPSVMRKCPKVVPMRRFRSGAIRRLALQIAAFLFSIQIHAQADSAQLIAEIDVMHPGGRVSIEGPSPPTAAEILFLSDVRLVVLAENLRPGQAKNASLTLFEIEKGGARQLNTIPVSESVLPISMDSARPSKVLEWVDPEHFMYWTYFGGSASRWLCDTNLDCRSANAGYEPGSIPHAASCNDIDFLGLINTEMAICFGAPAKLKWSGIVFDRTGRQVYTVEPHALPRSSPWTATFVGTIDGRRFGLDWESNTRLQLLMPLACIDECAPAGREDLVVFDSSSGKELRAFKWDPRRNSAFVFPALSPSGETVAFLRSNRLAIYALANTHSPVSETETLR